MREIIYNINGKNEDSTLKWGGVENEHNATVVAYKIDREFYESLGGEALFRIDFSSDGAGYDPSENLVADGEMTVKRSIPKKFTQYGGKMISTLVITLINDGNVEKEVLSLPCEIFFTSVKRRNEDLVYNLSACEEYMLSLLQRAENLVSQAESVKENLSDSLENVKREVATCVKKNQFADNKGNGGILRINSNFGISSGRFGNDSPETGDTVIIQTASNGLIKQRTQRFMPITPSNIDYAVKCALTDSRLGWSDDEKAAVRKFLGIKSESVILVDSAGIRYHTGFSAPIGETLKLGKQYTWSYYCSEYPGWLVDNVLEYPSNNKTEISSVAKTVIINGKDYIGLTAKCRDWANESGEKYVTVYYDNGYIKVNKNFDGENDLITIKR